MTVEPTTLSPQFLAIQRQLEASGQQHVLKFFEALDPPRRQRLLAEIEQIDWDEIGRLVPSHVKYTAGYDLPQDLQSPPWYPYRSTSDLEARYKSARACGEQLIRQGKVAVFTVAGGQGTRLGWSGPKGRFPATPIRKLSLFGCLGEQLQKVQQKYAASVPWYIMTSTANDAETRRFFEQERFFGLDHQSVTFFPQAMLPAFDVVTGKVLLHERDRLALSPNGHGGSLKALYTSGALDDMKARGIEQISYTQIDNPLVRTVDPLFIGLHAQDGAQMSSKMLQKAYPDEKLGNFCLADGKLTIVEYSDLPQELAEQRLENGQLRFLAGSIAIHVLSVEFVESINRGGAGFALPYHRAEKKVPFLDLETAQRVEPQAPNAVKLEMFVFDALPLCDVSIIYETDRTEEFAPIKNADAADAVDCHATSQRLQIERAARWLQSKGVQVPRTAEGLVDAVIEISPLTAIEADDLADAELPDTIDSGAQVLL